MTYELIITNIFRFLCLTCFSFIKNMILNPKLKQSFYGQRVVVFCNLEGGWGWWRCRGLWARRKHWDGIVWQPDRLSVSTEIIGSQDPPFGSACFYTDGSELMKKERQWRSAYIFDKIHFPAWPSSVQEDEPCSLQLEIQRHVGFHGLQYSQSCRHSLILWLRSSISFAPHP